jgi:hypothetical protein
MIVGLNSASEGFFETKPPYSNEQLLRFVRRVTSLGFEAVQIGPLRYFDRIEAGQLRTILDACKTERNVHVGAYTTRESSSQHKRSMLRHGKKCVMG